MSIECTAPKTYDNLEDDWLTLIGSSLQLSSLLYYVFFDQLVFQKKSIHSADEKEASINRIKCPFFSFLFSILYKLMPQSVFF